MVTVNVRRGLVWIGGGLLYGLALPPWDYDVCSWVALVPLLVATDRADGRQAFIDGALGGIAASWAVGWWIPAAAARFFSAGIWASAAAMTCVYVSIFGLIFGTFAFVVARCASGSRSVRCLLAAATWTALEFWRAYGLGQPWGLLGYTQHARLGLIQLAALTGVYGVSFVVVLGNAVVAECVRAWRSGAGWCEIVRPACAALVIVCAPQMFGQLMLAAPDLTNTNRIALIQTNVPPALHWTKTYEHRQLTAHLEATSRLLAREAPALVVWPEHALPFDLESEPLIFQELLALARRQHTDILLGAPRYADSREYNTAWLLPGDGKPASFYDKQRLVPFAEAGPLGRLLPTDPSAGTMDVTPGNEAGILRGFTTLGISICHEVLHADLALAGVRRGATVLVNIANDGWLDSIGDGASRQHFAMSIFRAVETRRYLVRSATTGISGIVDPYGRVVAALDTRVAGTLVGGVVPSTVITPYVRYGDVFATGCVGAVLGWLLVEYAARRRRQAALVPADAPA